MKNENVVNCLENNNKAVSKAKKDGKTALWVNLYNHFSIVGKVLTIPKKSKRKSDSGKYYVSLLLKTITKSDSTNVQVNFYHKNCEKICATIKKGDVIACSGQIISTPVLRDGETLYTLFLVGTEYKLLQRIYVDVNISTDEFRSVVDMYAPNKVEQRLLGRNDEC